MRISGERVSPVLSRWSLPSRSWEFPVPLLAAGLLAAILLVFSVGPAAAQTACDFSSPASTNYVGFPTYTDLVSGMSFFASASGGQPPLMVGLTAYGAARINLSNPESPGISVIQVGSRWKGPVPMVSCDQYQAVTAGGGWTDPDGSGRIAIDWVLNCGASGHGDGISLSPGGVMSYGQQLDPSGDGSFSKFQPVAVAKAPGGKFFGYYATPTGLRAVDISAMSGSASTAPIKGFQVDSATSYSALEIGSDTSTPYLFGTTGGVLHAWAINSSGTLASKDSAGGAGALKDFAVTFVSGDYYVFAVESSVGIGVFKFSPSTGSFSTVATIPGPSGDAYTSVKVSGSSVPVVFAYRSMTQQTDVIAATFLTQGGAPQVAGTIPLPSDAQNLLVWEAYVPAPSGGTTYAYIYRIAPPATLSCQPGVYDCAEIQPRLLVSQYDISCAVGGITSPPSGSFSVSNVSGHVSTDSTNYVGDTFQLQDSSTGAPTSFQWDLNDTGAFSPDASIGSVSGFQSVLPCDPASPQSGNISTGASCYNAGSPPTSQTIGHTASNVNGPSPVVTKNVSLALPKTKVKNLTSASCTSGCTVQLLSGNPIDAGISQGSPSSYVWTPAACGTGSTCAGSNFSNGASFSVAARYRGGYQAPTITGTVQVTAVIASFDVPSLLGKATSFQVTNNSTKGSNVSILGLNYVLDQSSGQPGSGWAPAPSGLSSSFPGGTATFSAPATAGTYYMHFQINYSAGGVNGSAFWNSSAITVSDVVYDPVIYVYNSSTFATVCTSSQTSCSLKTGILYLFADQGDSGLPAASAAWNFGDGTNITTDTTKGVSHTYSSTSATKVTLAVGNGLATATLNISLSSGSGGGGGGGTPTVTISGPTSLTTGQSGTWFANVSNANSGYTLSWLVDGISAGNSSSVTKSFSTTGNHTVAVTLSASNGSDGATRSVSVTSSGGSGGGSLAVTISGDKSLGAGQTGNWAASVSGNGGPVNITWYTSDNQFSSAGSGATLSHAFKNAGTYSVAVSITDTSNQAKAASTYSVSVGSGGGGGGGTGLPSADFTVTGASLPNPVLGRPYYAASAGDKIGFTAKDTGADTTFSWNFGDGTSGSGRSVQHVFYSSGSFTVQLAASNSAGSQTGKAQFKITGTAFQAYVVPGAAHYGNNATSYYATSLAVFNNSDSDLTMFLDFEPNQPGVNIDPTGLEYPESHVIPAHAGWSNPDVVGELAKNQSVLGNLFVKYLGAPPNVTSSIYVTGPAIGNSTYGTSLPVYPINLGGTLQAETPASGVDTLIGLRADADFYTSFTIISAGGPGGHYRIELLGSDGNPVAGASPIDVTLNAYQQAKIRLDVKGTNCNGFGCFLVPPSSGATYFARVSSTSPAVDAPFYAFASVLDKRTMDSLIITDETPLGSVAGQAQRSLFLAGVANVAGYKTDLYVLNASPQAVDLTLTFHYHSGGEELSQTGMLTVGGGQQQTVAALVSQLFDGQPPDGVLGDLRIDYTPDADGSPILVTGKNYISNPAGGTYGMQLPAFAQGDGLLPNDSQQIVLTGLRNDADAKSYLGLVVLDRDAPAGSPVVAHVRAFDSGGNVLFEKDFSVGGHLLYERVSDLVPAGATFNLVISAAPTDQGPAFAAFGVIQDLNSGDPVFLAGRRPQAN
jgi:PKD repeat protein